MFYSARVDVDENEYVIDGEYYDIDSIYAQELPEIVHLNTSDAVSLEKHLTDKGYKYKVLSKDIVFIWYDKNY